MKGLNKLALATAVAAAPFATQAMEPMNDSQMGDVTGQAGVTIELQTQVDIDQFSYTQTTEDDNTGSFVVDNISIGGLNRTGSEQDPRSTTFDASMDIDLQENGDALISFGGLHANEDGDLPVMLGFDFERAGLETYDADGDVENRATLMSDFTMDMYLKQLDITASTLELGGDRTSSDAGHLAIDVGFAMDMDVDVDVAAVGIRGLSMAGAERTAEDGTELDGTLETLKTGGAVDAIGDNPAVVNMTISAGAPIGTYSELNSPDQALVVNVDNFHADMWIDEVLIGASVDADGVSTIDATRSIGSIGLEGLQVSNTRLAIYGR